ncbi:hypothetical protein BGLA2_270034 [Burkholderia gladioli]|nr:hypothetical protein BGLA2_270034 [Burkholderia gladioli]
MHALAPKPVSASITERFLTFFRKTQQNPPLAGASRYPGFH